MIRHVCSLPTQHSYSFFPVIFIDFEIGSLAENPVLIDIDQNKEKSPLPLPTIPVSDRPTQPLVLMRSLPFEQEFRMFSIMFIKIQLKKLYCR